MQPSPRLALFVGLICLSGLATPALAGGGPSIIPGLGPDPRGQPVAEEPGRLGGGFIEFLVTGHAGSRAAAAPRPMAGAPRAYMATTGAGQDPDYGYEPAGAPPPGGDPSNAVPVPGYAMPRKAVDPAFVRQEVAWTGPQGPGTIVIDTERKFLFLVESGGQAMRYGIGVGRPGFLWAGEKTISRKAEWPDWTPPSDMLKRRPDLPLHMAGGITNPLGARAMYLGSTLYRIHGTNEPDTIGTNVSSGCIRLTNDDVSDLYSRVRVGTRVIVM